MIAWDQILEIFDRSKAHGREALSDRSRRSP
jgi:hypothetical protein